MQQRQPQEPRDFDNARVGQKLREESPHRWDVGRVGRAEIDEQQTNGRGAHAPLSRSNAARSSGAM